MSTADEIELAAWRLAFNHIADGTPDGVARELNAEMDRLEHKRDQWRRVAKVGARLASLGSVYEIESNDVHS